MHIRDTIYENLKLGKTKGVMFVDSNKEPNYKNLPQDQKELLDKQLKMMIETKYMFINGYFCFQGGYHFVLGVSPAAL